MQDEGYIKFHPILEEGPPLEWEFLRELDHWRQVLYDHKLIGAYENGIGYGNISCRWDATNQFVISGSATGGIPFLDARHYTLVTQVELESNTLFCRGPIVASSESMSHAVFYQACPEVHGVVHVHHAELWEKLLHRVPTTEASATYGTPEMAFSIRRLLAETDLRQRKLMVMEGHPEGIFAFGEDLGAAARRILEVLA